MKCPKTKRLIRIGRRAHAEAREMRARAETATAARDALAANNALQERSRDLRQSANQVGETGVALAQKESELRRATLEFDKQRLGILNQQVDRLRGAAQGYGALSIAEQIGYRQVAAQVAARGMGSLTHEQLGLLQRGGGGEAVQRHQMDLARNDPGFAQAQRQLGLGEGLEGAQNVGQALDAMRGRQEDLLTQVRQETAQDMARMAAGIRDVFGQALGPRLAEIIEGAIRDGTQAALQEVENRLRLMQAQR